MNLIFSKKLDTNEELVLRYIIHYGKCSTGMITRKKKIDSLSIFEYVNRNEYQMFKKIEEKHPMKKKVLLIGFI